MEKNKRLSVMNDDSDGSDGVEILEDTKTSVKSKKDEKREEPKSEKKRAIEPNIADISVEGKVADSSKKSRKRKATGDENVDEYEVEKIIEKKQTAKGLQYKVKWKGWEEEADMTWEPVENLKGSEKIIR